jgi:hypothetical protein
MSSRQWKLVLLVAGIAQVAGGLLTLVITYRPKMAWLFCAAGVICGVSCIFHVFYGWLIAQSQRRLLVRLMTPEGRYVWITGRMASVCATVAFFAACMIFVAPPSVDRKVGAPQGGVTGAFAAVVFTVLPHVAATIALIGLLRCRRSTTSEAPEVDLDSGDERPRRRRKRKSDVAAFLAMPALGLKISGVATVCVPIAWVAYELFLYSTNRPHPIGRLPPIVWLALLAFGVGGGYALYRGGEHMANLDVYFVAYRAAAGATANFLCLFLTAPIGIWALNRLSRPGVREAFRDPVSVWPRDRDGWW